MQNGLIMDAGKRIYKYDKPENLKYYTRTQIMKKLRNDGAKTKEDTSDNTIA